MSNRTNISRTNPNLKKKQFGFTALELAIVLLVAAVVIAFAATQGSKLWGDSQNTTEMQNISTLYNQTKNLKGTAGYGANGTSLLPTLAAMDALPKNMAYSGGVLTNSWGGTVTITSTGSGYSLTYNNVPQAACVELAQKVSRGGAMTTKPGGGAVVTGEVTAPVATAGCSAATNTLVFASLS